MSRGDTAVALAERLPLIQRRGALVVYEAHRLGFAHEIERATGRRWDGRVPETGPWRRAYAAEKSVVEGADGVVCLTDGVREELARLFTVDRPLLVLPSGTTVSAAASTFVREGAAEIIYAGKLMVRKGVPVLLQAMRHLPGRTLCVLGGTPDEVAESRRAIDGDELASRVDFRGFVAPRDVGGYLARARVGVCPLPAGVSITSERFTSSLKILELMAAGTPVVATDLPSVRAILTHGETGWLVPAGDPEALAAGIRRLLEDADLAHRLAHAALERVKAYSWHERARRLRGFLERLTGDSALPIENDNHG